MKIKQNVHRYERVVSVAAGVALGVYAIRRHGKVGSSFALATAGSLLARGFSGYCPANGLLGRGKDVGETRDALAGSGGIKLKESVTIRTSAKELYALWRPLTGLPDFMQHVERVDVIDARTSRWVMKGPAGMRYEWDAELINDVKPDLIAWRSLPGSEVVSAGSVTFRERERRGGVATEVTVTLQYDALGGKAGAFIAWMMGQSPASMLREDLRRFKSQVEANEAPTRARVHGARSVLGKVAGVDA